jgi:hypothetical protein
MPSGFVRRFVAWILETVVGDEHFASTLRSVRPKPVHEYHALVAQRDAFTRDFYEAVR